MPRIIFLALLTAAFIGALFWIKGKAPQSESTVVPDTAPISVPSSDVVVIATPTPVATQLMHASPTPAATRSSAKAIHIDRPPSLSKIRKEVAKDPHSTPPSLLRFSADLGVRMEAAAKNHDDAQALLKELKDCAIPKTLDSSTLQARALCLVSARELEQTWPDLKPEAEGIVDRADSKARELAAKVPGYERK